MIADDAFRKPFVRFNHFPLLCENFDEKNLKIFWNLKIN